MTGSAHGLTPPRSPDWRDQAACPPHQDDMFPGSNSIDIKHAKDICRSCPVIDQCRQWALETREEYGVWGGMSEADRRAYFRRKGIRLDNVDGAARKPNPKRTLRSLWAQRAVSIQGHTMWTGSVPVSFRGRYLTPRQIAFRLDRGHNPVGIVRRTCDVDGCVRQGHLMDQAERNALRRAAA